jgi:hypothetical protein
VLSVPKSSDTKSRESEVSDHRSAPRPSALTAVLAAAWLAACGPAATSGTSGSAAGQEVTVTVRPTSASVPPGGQQPFAASVTGSASTAVAWSVQEGSAAGAVSVAGLFTASSTPGTYHVVATSAADPTRTGVATITVLAPVAVAVSPRAVTVAAGGTTTFTAAVSGTADTAVAWSVVEATGCGAISAAGVYAAPPAGATCHVAATSHADPARSDVATVTVTPPPPPVAVTVSPASGAVDECQPLAFTASVTGSTNTAVTWSLQEGAAAGAISAAGVYTAGPAGTYHVVATSAADPTRSSAVPVTVTQHVLGVAVSPATITVPANGTAQFSASVTTTCGTTTALRVVDSKGRISAAN